MSLTLHGVMTGTLGGFRVLRWFAKNSVSLRSTKTRIAADIGRGLQGHHRR